MKREFERQRLYIDLRGTLIDPDGLAFTEGMVEAVEHFVRARDGRLEVMVVTNGHSGEAEEWAIRLRNEIKPALASGTVLNGAPKIACVDADGLVEGDVWVDDDPVLKASIEARDVAFLSPAEFMAGTDIVPERFVPTRARG